MDQDLDEQFSGDWAKTKRRSSLLNSSLREIQENAPEPVVLNSLVQGRGRKANFEFHFFIFIEVKFSF